jgi:hypothetical protein
MTTFLLPLDKVTSAVLDSFVVNRVGEGRQLEYKGTLHLTRPSERTEFLRDVSAFANAVGGDILFGMHERREADNKQTGEAGTVVGLPGLNLDATKQLIENLLRDGLDPPLTRVEFHPVERPGADPCLILRIQRSWTGPHRVTYDKHSEFHSRNSSGRFPLDTAGIREAMLMSATAEERVRALRRERIERLRRGEAPVPFGEGSFFAFHALPLIQDREAWDRLLALDIADRLFRLAPSSDTGGLDKRFNLDGFVSFPPVTDVGRAAYVQAFRDGGIEAAYRIVRNPRTNFIHAINYERATVGVLSRAVSLWKQLGVEPPIATGLALSGVKGEGLVRDPDLWGPQGAFDRDVVEIPAIILYDLAPPAPELLKPLFDHMWNSAGWEASPYYDKDGRWTVRQ